METISQKSLFSRGKTNLAIFPSYYRKWQTSGKILLGCTRYGGNHCASFNVIFVTLKRLLKTQFFDKKKTFSCEKSFPGIFFSHYRVKKNLKEQIIGVYEAL